MPEHGNRAEVPDPATHAVTIDRVTVAYPGRTKPAIEGCSLTIEPGEAVAITGPSGCGKSTLVSVLLGFTAPSEGTVRIGDVDLTDIDPAAWREHIAWVPQRPHLFAASIAENLRLGAPHATDDELWSAVSAASLEQRIASLPDQLDTRLGERGSGLSAGEAQRLAIARALLKPASLLLLDEPTAHLDADTEARVISSLQQAARGRSMVVVTHRPAVLSIVDRVVSLEPATVLR